MSNLLTTTPNKLAKMMLPVTVLALFGCQPDEAFAKRHVTILEIDSMPVAQNQLQDPRTLINNAVASKTFSADGLFVFNKSQLKDLSYYQEDFENLAAIAKAENLFVRVDAFADEIGTQTYNLKLSQKRAKTVADYLVNRLGVSRNKIISTGWGENYPVVECDTSKSTIRNKTLRQEAIECLKPNRRVTISVVK